MPPELVWLLGGALAAGTAVGAAGFADALILNAVWLQVLPPREAVPLVMASGALMQSASSLRLGARVERATLAALVAAGVVGVPLGVLLLEHASPRPYRIALGALLAGYCTYELIRLRVRDRSLAAVARDPSRAVTAAVGLTAGVLGGFAGLSGILPTGWAGRFGWPSDRQRALYQPFILAMHVVGLGWLAARGMIDPRLAERLLWCVPALLAGLALGHRVYRVIDARRFRMLVLALFGICALTLLRS